MKQFKFLLVIFFSTIVMSSWAQSIEITPSYGFQFGSKLSYGSNYIKIDDGDQYGLTVGFELDTDLVAEVTYFRHSTELNIRDIILSPVESRLTDLNIDWFLVGASKYFSDNKVKPFAGGGLGFVVLTPKNENFDLINRGLDNQTRFTFSFKTGVNAMITDVVGVNLQFNLLLPVSWGGVYVGGGPGGVGAGAGVSGTTVIGSFSGGLVFKLGS